MDLLLTAPSPEPAGLLASRLALAGESGELLLLFGVAGGDVTLGVAGATYAIMASLSRHFTSSACQSKSHVHIYLHNNIPAVSVGITVRVNRDLKIRRRERLLVLNLIFRHFFVYCQKIDTLESNASLLYFLHQKCLHCYSYWRRLKPLLIAKL